MSSSILTPMVMPHVTNDMRRRAALLVCELAGVPGNPTIATELLATLGLVEKVEDGTWWARGPVENGQLWDGTHVFDDAAPTVTAG